VKQNPTNNILNSSIRQLQRLTRHKTASVTAGRSEPDEARITREKCTPFVLLKVASLVNPLYQESFSLENNKNAGHGTKVTQQPEHQYMQPNSETTKE